MLTKKPVQAIQPRIVETNRKPPKTIETLQRELQTNPSFTPRVVCPPFGPNTIVNYPVSSPTSPPYPAPYGIPMLSPIQQMYPLHQTVLLNPYLPQMQTSFLKQFPTIEEAPECPADKKFSSLNTRNPNKRPPQFQSMRVVRKRMMERFYPNTEYGENFNEINNNKSGNQERSGNKDDCETVIYANYPHLLKVKSNISGIEEFQNLTDSIQVCEEFQDNSLQNISNESMNKPVPAPRTKISPFCSPTKPDHVYINMSMPIINRSKLSYDIPDVPVRPSKSVDNIIEKNKTEEKHFEKIIVKKTSSSTNDLPKIKNDNILSEEDDNDEEIDEKVKACKPNIIAATPKKSPPMMLPSTALVRSAVNKLNSEANKDMSKDGPKKQIITPNKTLQIPKLAEKPIPKRTMLRRSNSAQCRTTSDLDCVDNTQVECLLFILLEFCNILCVLITINYK